MILSRTRIVISPLKTTETECPSQPCLKRSGKLRWLRVTTRSGTMFVLHNLSRARLYRLTAALSIRSPSISPFISATSSSRPLNVVLIGLLLVRYTVSHCHPSLTFNQQSRSSARTILIHFALLLTSLETNTEYFHNLPQANARISHAYLKCDNSV